MPCPSQADLSLLTDDDHSEPLEGTQMVRSRMVTGIAVAGAVAVGGIGGAIIGVPGLSGAQQFPTSATATAATGTAAANRPLRDSALIDAAAKALNLTSQQLMTKLSDGKTTIADVAKAQKVDINTVITAMSNADHTRISDIVNQPWPKFAPGGPRLGGPPFGRAFGRFGGVALDQVAAALGIAPADLKADLAKGQTIAQIAKSKNVDVNGLINTLVTDASKRIDQAVTAGHLDKDRADKLKASLKTEITNLVNNGFPKVPAGGFGFGGRARGHGPGSGSNAGPFGGAGGGPSTSSPTTAAPTS